MVEFISIMDTQHSTGGFGNLGIAPKLLEILSRSKFTQPTPIQSQSIPIAIQGKDVMGIAQTGTGKTLAFGIPMLQSLAQNKGKKGLVLLPTRELAYQVDESLRKLGQSIGLKTAVLIGGESMDRQIRMLRQDPHIIVATPGRLNDHLVNSKLSLQNVSVLVLDEADHMLDMGFEPQIRKILARIPKQRQTMLFSATMPPEIINMANSYMHMPLRVEVTPPRTTVKSVTQELIFVDKNRKNDLLKSAISEFNGSVLVFTKTKYKAKDVTRFLKKTGLSAEEIHSNRSQSQRRKALDGFKMGKYRVLVATDIAARGIDVKGIELVVNYDLPATADDYVHRIGRTGRAGLTGRAITFATPDQRRDVTSMERLIKQTLTKKQHNLGPASPESYTPSASREYPKREYPRREYSTSRPRTPSSAASRDSARPAPRNSRGGFSDRSKPRGKSTGRRQDSQRDDRIPTSPRTSYGGRRANSDGEGYFMSRNK